jgi:ribonucleotide monophosphatase NagD (HAD superfamily)
MAGRRVRAILLDLDGVVCRQLLFAGLLEAISRIRSAQIPLKYITPPVTACSRVQVRA